VFVRAFNNNDANVDTRGIIGGAVGVGVNEGYGTAAGRTKAHFDGNFSSTGSGDLNVTSTARSEADVLTRAVAGGLFAASGNTSNAMAKALSQAYVRAGSVINTDGGTVNVNASAALSADARTEGVNAGALAVGVSLSNATAIADVAAALGATASGDTWSRARPPSRRARSRSTLPPPRWTEFRPGPTPPARPGA
jgi:hypothetical protein